MFNRTQICSAVVMAMGGGLILGAAPASAQSDPAQQQLERVEITGSSVRRIDAEAALPVQVLKRADIERSGATSAVDLLRRLPTIQGSTGESASVGGNTYGFAGVSIHAIGEERTLVLLNGQRMALFGGQTLTGFAAAFDLNALPISAIERVEVLTDGASALYGSDAIAGVVNFITKHNTTEGDGTIGYSAPKDGAREKRISASKGFGKLEEDGFNVFFSVSHDERTVLRATDRDFANTGQLYFQRGGKNYRFQQYSASSIPANYADDDGNGLLFNPTLRNTGACAPKSFRVTDDTGDYCGFNFVGELEIYPERKRDSATGSVVFKAGDHELFADLLFARSKSKAGIAPVPGGVGIDEGSPLYNQYLAPLGAQGDAIAFYRVYDLGLRTNDDTADFYNIRLGSRGAVAGWDYEAAFNRSRSKAKSSISGYPGGLALSAVLDAGLLNPFVGPGQQSAEGAAALNNINYNGYWDGGTSTLNTVSVKGSREIAQLPAGPLQLGIGANFNQEKFDSQPSLYAQAKLADPVAGTLCDPANPALPCDQRFGDSSSTVPYSADRRSYGAFAELVIPVFKQLELGASVRFDHYSDFGAARTAKGSFRYTPMPELLIRGSLGTGFHAPTVPQVNAAAQPYGVTADNYACSAAMATIASSLGGVCRPGTQQYDSVASGNKELEPERSKQATLGFRLEPTRQFSFGADFWWVGIRDAFGQVTEQAVFANPAAFPGAWTTNLDIATGRNYLAFLQTNANLGKKYTSGIDFDVVGRGQTGLGDITSQLTLTYMLRDKEQIEKDGQYYSSVADNSELGFVTFRMQGKLITTLATGNWFHTLGFNFRTGYADQEQTVDVLDAAGNVTGTEDIRLEIPFYSTFDWQSQWNLRKDVSLTFGILNVGDRKPPLSLATGGRNQGQQVGFDDRYYDPRGRTFYINASYKF